MKMEYLQKIYVLHKINVYNVGITSLILAIVIASQFCSNGLVGAATTDPRGNDWRDLMLTQAEKEKLDMFKKKVAGRLPESFMETDFYLIRWLRARNFDIDKAWEMLYENIKWRQENRIANILSEDFSDVSEDFTLTADSNDKKGRPVGTTDFGRWDLRSAALVGKLPRVSRQIDFMFERLVHQILAAQQSGRAVTRAIIIHDMEGLNFYQHLCPSCLAVSIRIFNGIEAHYPGFCEEVIFINVSGVTSMLFNALKGSMSPSTREAIKIFGTNKEQWGVYLRERIDRDQLYPNYGGTKKHGI